MKTGIELIAEERQRQIDEEGYSFSHDKLHADGEISLAAACYAAHPLEIYYKEEYATETHFKQLIPFNQYKIDNKKSELRKLVIAGALIAAEIDRLQNQNK
jgi:hypothetical protein